MIIAEVDIANISASNCDRWNPTADSESASNFTYYQREIVAFASSRGDLLLVHQHWLYTAALQWKQLYNTTCRLWQFITAVCISCRHLLTLATLPNSSRQNNYEAKAK